MKKNLTIKLLTFWSLILFAYSCNGPSVKGDLPEMKAVPVSEPYTLKGGRSFSSGYQPLFPDGDINVVVEIPTGTVEKWEVDKATGDMKWEFVDNKPRTVAYLGYPGNYGMIPQTLLPKEMDGDGDPLDVIVLGPPVERGSIIKCKLIGVLRLLDRGEKDDKLIAVSENTSFYKINNINELNSSFEGVTKILQLWFTNYKGPEKMESTGYGSDKEAKKILDQAIIAYRQENGI